MKYYTIMTSGYSAQNGSDPRACGGVSLRAAQRGCAHGKWIPMAAISPPESRGRSRPIRRENTLPAQWRGGLQMAE